MTADRKITKGILAQELSSSLELEEMHGHAVDDLGGKSPVGVLLSAGSLPERITPQMLDRKFYFDLSLYVLYAKPDENWTPEKAEDQMDELEGEVEMFIITRRSFKGAWRSIGYAGRSVINIVEMLQGETYLREIIPLVTEV